MTVDVTVGSGANLVFSPSSVTIHSGDQVRWDLGFERPQHNVRLPGATGLGGP
jgi:plastocyanin